MLNSNYDLVKSFSAAAADIRRDFDKTVFEPVRATFAEDTRICTLSLVMVRAWAIRRRAAVDLDVDVSAVLFSACLKMAWAETKKAERVEKYTADAGRAAVSSLADWAALDDAGKVDAIRRAVWSAAARHGAFIGIPAADVLTDDINAYVNEAWLHIGAALDNSAENIEKITARNITRAKIAVPALTLNALLMQPARAAIAAIYRDTRKHAAHDVHGYTDDDGAEFDPFALIAALDDTEAAAVAAAAVEKFAATRDAIDRAIINRNGKTTRQLAAELHISAMAISKRAAKMRRDWYAFIA